ncbi:MAG: flavin oxidoreductase/NADH oxidase [Clostridia bacterium]|nr:flavin oxidoreductase/NADH oxidase [Clostridia bacterium]
MPYEPFRYQTAGELQAAAEALGVSLPLAADTAVLCTSVRFAGMTLPNRLGTAPMEGADALPNGAPSELTARRYIRNAEGGSALVWFEAVCMTGDGRSSAGQLLLNSDTLDAFKRLTERVKEAGLRANGYAPLLVMQVNHSGRYANPGGKPAPKIAYRHPYLERFRPASDADIVSDDYLRKLEEKYGEAAALAKKAGFDAADIKACHGYLSAELLSAVPRPGAYGGSYENRTRFLKNAVAAALPHADAGFFITARIGIYDGYPESYGFGAAGKDDPAPDYTEPIRLLGELHERYGLAAVNLTMGNPYVTTHVTRPFDRGMYDPPEHPLTGIARMIDGIAAVKRAVPGLTVYASAPSYLRQFADLFTAGAVEEGRCDGMLFGRLSFADPDFANEILKTGRLDPKHVCLTCGKCGDLIRSHYPTGCAVRDTQTYLPYYRQYLAGRAALPENFRG